MAEPSQFWREGSRPSGSSLRAPVRSEPMAGAATPTREPTVNHQPPPPPLPPAREASPQPISVRPVQPISARSTGGRCPAVPRATERRRRRREPGETTAPGPVALETASLPSGASGLKGPSNCLLEIENLMLLFAAAPDPGKLRKRRFCLILMLLLR